nr:AAC_HP1_G0008080.mRNA.1.CDS.1 [Saccharomyces cerevisiae]
MHYVVLELQVAHLPDTPKDQCRIANIAFQIVNAETLVCHYGANSLPSIEVNGTTKSLESAMVQLDKDIHDVIGNDDFVLVSLYSTWHIRVTLPRQARDDGFILTSYLQHPKVFDLWKEFDRWCVNHPEILGQKKAISNNNCNTKSNSINAAKNTKDLDEIVRILEVSIPTEEAGSVPEIYSLLKRTTDILIQLHKKCTSPEDMESVLTKPYDSHTDIRAFLQEKSKILYMNNLPPDTTQSELESWFTQYGVRPVGFWTVKNIVEDTSNVNNNWSLNNSPYVEDQDSISGFVVFQTHEEATEVLALNGRSILSNLANTKQPRVVEHVLELQPSSTGVLDKAQEILSPFPQSKNKPRPGDWNCPSCGFSNFQRRTACFRCSFPAPSNSQIHTANSNNNVNSSRNNLNNRVNSGSSSNISNTAANHPYGAPEFNMIANNTPAALTYNRAHFPAITPLSRQNSLNMAPSNSGSPIIIADHFSGNNNIAPNYRYNNNINNNNNNINNMTNNRYNINNNINGNGNGNGNNSNNNNNHNNNHHNGSINSNSNTNNNNNNNNNGNNSNNCNSNIGMGGCGSNIPFRAGDWKCSTCTYHNFAKNVVCLRCGGPKSISGDASETNHYIDSSTFGPASRTPSNNNISVNTNGGSNAGRTDGNDNKGRDISLMEFMSPPLSMATKSMKEGDGNGSSFNEFKSDKANVNFSNVGDNSAFGNGFNSSVRW